MGDGGVGKGLEGMEEVGEGGEEKEEKQLDDHFWPILLGCENWHFRARVFFVSPNIGCRHPKKLLDLVSDILSTNQQHQPTVITSTPRTIAFTLVNSKSFVF